MKKIIIIFTEYRMHLSGARASLVLRSAFTIFAGIAMLLSATGCDILDKYPLDKPSQETFWNNAGEINAGVVACYRFIIAHHDTYMAPIVLDAMTDTGFPRQDSNYKTIAKGEHDSNTYIIREWWHGYYQGVGRCNLMLEVIEQKAGLLTEDQYKQFKGECLFLRAYYYSMLITHWGDVPLVLKPIKNEAEASSYLREDREKVLVQIFTDFDDAALLLKNRYTEPAEIGRATRGAANAYKARIALYNGKWDVAATAANEVIISGTYTLYPEYGKLFLTDGLWDEANKEVILQAEFSSLIPLYHSLPLYMHSRNLSGYAAMVPSQNLIDSYHCIDGKNIAESGLFDKSKPFENRDPRLRLGMVVPGDPYGDFQFESHVDSATCHNYATGKRVENKDCYSYSPYTSYTGYHSRKFSDPAYIENHSKADYPIILCRFAEVLLTYAEAKIEADDVDGTVVNALNQIRRGRSDVKMPAVTIDQLTDKDAARVLVRHERKIELAFEGFRYIDLRRWDGFWKYANRPVMGRPFKGEQAEWPDVTFDENNEPVYDYNNYEGHPSKDYRVVEIRSFVQNKHELWPIPQRERNVSPQLTQNKGY